MTVKAFFAIIAVLALVHGVGFVVVPEQVAASYGMAVSAPTVLMARLFGAALIGLGLIFWFSRDGSSESVRSVFFATVIGNTGLDCNCYGDRSGYPEFYGMGCGSNLSVWSSGIRLLPDGKVAPVVGPVTCLVLIFIELKAAYGRLPFGCLVRNFDSGLSREGNWTHSGVTADDPYS
jgi:hypothetical protein